jgi:orotidine-5'-phosphate decarboxylase
MPLPLTHALSVLHQVAADVTTKSELLTLADKLGPHICMLKTHADIVQDWDANTGTLPRLSDVSHNNSY